jgi:hypothetical protein
MVDNRSAHGLRRFWFPFNEGLGIGVTAFSDHEARDLAEATRLECFPRSSFAGIVPDVDIRTLDQNHVVPNMGVVTVRGVWFPRRNA